MKRVGIITIPDYNNYGNRLQNYAVKKYFEKLDFQVDTLELNDSEFEKYRERKYKLIIKKYRIKPLVFAFEMLKSGLPKARREYAFERFTTNNLSVVYEPTCSMKTFNKLTQKYDFFVLGSDQIWHPTVNSTPNLFFATFAEPEQVIYYAPSFGVSELSNEYREKVRNYLQDAKNISVREKEGATIIKDLLGREVEVLADPTLMLDAEEWRAIAKKPKRFIREKYILTIFLGPVSEEYNRQIEEYKKKTGLPIYSLADVRFIDGYVTGPSEFIYAIMNAEIVLTDSFHATVFSIIFEKKFLCFSRLGENNRKAGLDSRVDEMLEKMGLEKCKYIEGRSIDVNDIEFVKAKEVIAQEKKKTGDYLRKSLIID